MSVTQTLAGSRARRRLLLAAVAAGLVLVAAAALDGAFAQASPFGVGRPSSAPAATDGIVGWIMARQAEFYRGLSGMIRAAKADGSAVWGLLGLSFLYGVFHAAGPGHGKAVISSYLVANDETWRRGVALSFAAAFVQALAAVVLVGVAAVIFRATSGTMCSAERVIEIASYGLIVLIGARLLWVKGRGFLAAAHEFVGARRPAPVGAAVTPPDHDRPHDHGGSRAHDHHQHHHHHHDPHHEHDAHCGHAHGPEPEMLAGRGGWQRGLSAVVAVGLRPCSGAILVLVFALAQGLFWAGVASTFVMGLGTAITVAVIASLTVAAKEVAARLASTGSGAGTLAMRGLEVLASVVVIAFGLLLLGGYIIAERSTCL